MMTRNTNTRLRTAVLGLAVLLVATAGQARTLEAHSYGKIIQVDHCTVPGETVTLGDVATVELPDPEFAASLEAVELTRAPAYGSTVELSQNYLVVKLKQHYGNLDDILIGGARTTTVQRAGATVTQADLQDAVEQYIYRETNADPNLMEIVPRGREQSIGVPEGDIDIRVYPNGSRLRGNVSFRAEIRVDGALVTTASTNVFIRQYAWCVVADKNIQAGDALTSDNLDIQKTDITYSSSTDDMLMDLEPVEGMVARQFIYAGRLIEPDMAGNPTLVQNGAKVSLLVQVGHVQVSAHGIAKQKGGKGDTIRVLNLASDKLVQGIIDENGAVHLNGL